MKKKPACIWIAAGGTGGHIFPAQALARDLEKKGEKVVFIGKGLSVNRYFSREIFSFHDVKAAPISLKKPLRSLFSLGYGIVQAFCLLVKQKPRLVVGFGSYHAFPVVAAAFIKRVPFVLFESNAVPGRVNRIFSPFAEVTALQFPGAKKGMKGRFQEVTFPLWGGKEQKDCSRQEALAYFGLQEGKKTLLIFGGSQGASFLNDQVLHALKRLQEPIQVIHLIGQKGSLGDVILFYKKHGIEAVVKLFEEKMDLAWTAADLAVCRSGASTCAEVLFFAVPALFIPYPQSKDEHQLKNALFMEEEVQGAVCLEEHTLTSELLAESILSLSLEKMRESLILYRSRKQLVVLADLVQSQAKEKGKPR